MNPHTTLVQGILDLLRLHRIPAYPTNTGAAMMENKRFVRFGFPGVADVTGILPPKGRYIAIEAKTGRGKLAQAQRDFKCMVQIAGGLYFEVRDLGVFDNQLKELK